jgi:hypothetical protein
VGAGELIGDYERRLEELKGNLKQVFKIIGQPLSLYFPLQQEKISDLCEVGILSGHKLGRASRPSHKKSSVTKKSPTIEWGILFTYLQLLIQSTH